MNCAGTRSVLRCSTSFLKKHRYRTGILRPTSSSTSYKFEALTHFSQSTMTRASKEYWNQNYESTQADDFDCEEKPPFADVDYAALAGDDPVALKKLKALQLELYMRHQRGDTIPKALTTAQWAKLLDISSSSVRNELLERFWMEETQKKDDSWRKKIVSDSFTAKRTAASAKEELIEVTTCSPVIYSLDRNTLFVSISDARVHRFYNYKLHQAAMYSTPMMVDCSYESVLTDARLYSCVEEIKQLWYANRSSLIPFHIMFCNLDPAGKLWRKIQEYFPESKDPGFPFFHTYKTPVELYPEEKFVFLVPFAREHLRKFDPNCIYVVDVIDNFVENESPARVKAKAYERNLAKIPLNKQMQWCTKGTALSPKLVVCIMNEIKNTPEWKYSFRRMATAKETELGSETNDGEKNIRRRFSLNSPLLDRLNERFRRNKAYDLLLTT